MFDIFKKGTSVFPETVLDNHQQGHEENKEEEQKITPYCVPLLSNEHPHEGSIHDVKFSHDGNLLATACFDGKLRLWDVKTGTLKHTITKPVVENKVINGTETAPTNTVHMNSLDFHPQATRIACVMDNLVVLFDYQSGKTTYFTSMLYCMLFVFLFFLFVFF